MLGLVTNPVAILSALAGPAEETVSIPGLNQEFPVPTYEGMFLVLHLLLKTIGFFLAMILIVGSVTSLLRKPWARNLMRGWAVVYILKVLGEQVVDTVVMMPLVAESLPAGGEMGSGVESLVMGASAILALLCGLICWGIYPVCVLLFFSSSAAEEAFGGGPGGNGWPPPGGGGDAAEGAPPQGQPQWTAQGGWQPTSPHQQGPQQPPPPGYGPPQPPHGNAYPPPPPIEAGPDAFDSDEEKEDGGRR